MLIDRSDYLLTRLLPDGGVLDVVPLMFGRARIIISASIEDPSWFAGW